MVKQRRLGLAITSTLLLTTAVSACQPAQPTTQEQPSPTTPTSIRPVPKPTPSPTPSPSPSPSPAAHQSFPPPEPGEPAEITAIRKGWEENEKQWDRYAKDSSLNELTPLVLTTTGQYSIDVVHEIGELRDHGHIRVGDVIIRSVHIEKPQRNADGVNVSTVTICKDFTHQKIIEEKTGKPANAQQGGQWTPNIEFSIVMQQLPNGRWAVADYQGRPKEC